MGMLEILRFHQFYAFVESKECRHRQLLEHFGQSLAGCNCGACDACVELGGVLCWVQDLGQRV